jgi:glucan endo-1,3-beta-D-glucosidase
MRATTTLLALAASISTVTAAAYQGFNYGSTNSDGSIKTQQTYQDEFKTAKNLVGTSGFTSARLYTSIQGGTTNDPTFAIPAAIAEDTTLLLGIWASGGQVIVDNEIAALKTAISTYGTSFTSRVTGLSVGSEDLYRISPTGIAAKSGYGAEPDELVAYIQRVRAALADTPLASVPIGHVDTWNDWVNGSNSAVVQAVDWVGVDAYPYYQTSMANSIENGASLFFAAYDATVAAAAGKPVWITETGWPVSGPASGQAVASADNAKTFWDAVACKVLGNINTYWFTLQDSSPVTPSPSFGIVGSVLTTTPIYDLSCAADQSGQSTTSADPTTAVLTSLKEVQVSTAPATEASSTTIPATGGVELTASSSTSDTAISATSVSTVPTRAASAAAEASTTAVPTTLATTPAGAAATAGTVSGSATGAAGNGTVVSPTATTSAFTGAAATAGPMMVGAAAVMAVMAAL